MKNKTEYQVFQDGLIALVNGATDVTDERLSETLFNYLDKKIIQLGYNGVARGYAVKEFLEHLRNEGRDSIADLVMEWAEECANDIRWPVAYVYTATGKLPGGYRENTTVTVVLESREGEVLEARLIHWRDFSHIEDDTKCYKALNDAILNCVVDLGARSVFEFHSDATIREHYSIAHHPEQGASLFHFRTYD